MDRLRRRLSAALSRRPLREREGHPASPRSRTTRKARRARLTGAGAAAAVLLLPLACVSTPASARQPDHTSLQKEFTEAAQRYHVPAGVLLAVSYMESRWDGHDGAPSVAGGYGPMHLTDARTALARTAAGSPRHTGEDGRGDTSRPAPVTRTAGKLPAAREVPARLRTVSRAAELTGLPAKELRQSPGANISGGAALLADAQRKLGRPLSQDPADWFDAVAAYPGEKDKSAGTSFAGYVFEVLRAGEQRTTDSGQRVSLRARPGLRAGSERVRKARTAGAEAAGGVTPECPRSVSCEWYPAPYQEFTDSDGTADYGNHDITRRPGSQSVKYIVVHDTEVDWDGALKLVKDPTYVSWNYTVRSSDGHIAQHVRDKDVAWHAGNWYINSTSVGVEQEGFLTAPDSWFTEAMYRSSARLVRYLADRYGIPLDRQHILGHDNVPGTTAGTVAGMHTDPGPYFDWQHYFALMGKPFEGGAAARGGMVTIRPDYRRNDSLYTGCDASGNACPAHGSEAVRLHTAPDAGSPLVRDEGLHPGGGASTTDVNDVGARASTGQTYAVAGRERDWTAIWYLGQKAWFRNPAARPTAVASHGTLVVPRKGKSEIPVYGRAYPEAGAYPDGVPVQGLSPLPYTIKPGQAYATSGPKVRGEYLYAVDYDPEGTKFQVVRGKLAYREIQLGHRVAFVKADDVREVRSSS